jgi:hypothetical protein
MTANWDQPSFLLGAISGLGLCLLFCLIAWASYQDGFTDGQNTVVESEIP